MNYSVRIKLNAAKELSKLPESDRIRIAASIDLLAENPYLGVVLKGRLIGLSRLWDGRYRTVYEV